MDLYVESTGAGEPLVLVHAGVADCHMFDAQVAAFAPRYRVIRYDAQGFGRSPMAQAPRPRAEDLLTVLRAQGVERAHLVGVSMGGATVIDFAVEHPEMVGALIPVASGVSGLDRPADPWLVAQNALEDAALERGDLDAAEQADLQTWLAGPRRRLAEMDPAVVALLAPMARSVLQGDLVRKATPQIEPPAAGRLGEIRAPTLVLVGDLDVDAVLATTDVLARGIPGARKQVLTGTAHLPNLEQPDTFNTLILAFLAEHPLS